jgi:hypothetical protein
MTFMEIFAFVIMPVLVVAIGWGGVWLHMRNLNRPHSRHPAE